MFYVVSSEFAGNLTTSSTNCTTTFIEYYATSQITNAALSIDRVFEIPYTERKGDENMTKRFEEYTEKFEIQYTEMDRPFDPAEYSEQQLWQMAEQWNKAKTRGYWTMFPGHCFRGLEEDIFVKIHSSRLAGKRGGGLKMPHNHEFFEMVYVYRGELHNEIDGTDIVQRNRTAVLLNPYALHHPYTDSPQDIVYNILFKTEIITNTFLQLLSSDDNQIIRFFLNSVYGISHTCNYLYFQLSEDLSRLIQQIIAEWYDQKAMYRQVIVGDVIRLFAGLARDYHKQNAFSYLTSSEDTASRILQYMKQNYATTSIRDISDQFHCSPSAVSQMVKRKFSKNFSEIIMEFKMESACNYLKNSTLSTEKIAEIIGYNDLSYFHKVFKKNFSMTPKEYRTKFSIYSSVSRQKPGL